MFGRLKSSLEKRAPGVVDALRGLRGGREAEPPQAASKPAPAASKPAAPVAAAKPAAPVAAAKPAAPVAAAKPAAPVAASKPAAPVAAAKPAAAAKPVARAAAAEPAAPAAAAKPAAAAEPSAPAVEKPAAAAKPAAEKKPAAAAAPAVEKPAAAAKPAAPAKPAAAAKPAAHAADKPAADKKPKHLHADTGSTDVEAYIARARANGRDVALIKGTEGINLADDGVAYSGPLDNESSRAKAAQKLLTIDQFECISCGTCVEQTEKVFYLPADGKATPIAQDGPMDLIQDAIEACPVTCIHWVTPDEAIERGLTSGVEG